jgi:hypothetical protein
MVERFPVEFRQGIADSGLMPTTAAAFILKASKLRSNSFVPAQLAIFSNRVEYRGKTMLGNQESTTIGFPQIANVAVKTGLVGASLTIETTGGQRLSIDKVKPAEARQAESMLNELRFG